MREEGKQEVFEDQEKEDKDLGVERESGRREARREQDHRAGARVDMKHLRAQKPADHQPQLACFRDTKTLGAAASSRKSSRNVRAQHLLRWSPSISAQRQT